MKKELEKSFNYEKDMCVKIFNSIFEKILTLWLLIDEYKRKKSLKIFLQKRMLLYKEILFYSIFLLIDDIEVNIIEFFEDIEFGNKLEKDDSITVLEQKLPREVYLRIYDYYLIDDAQNELKEKEILSYARKIIDSQDISNLISPFNDDLLEKLIKHSDQYGGTK